jgi:LysM repeat protein
MAISVGRLSYHVARADRLERYAVRLTALFAYVGAVAVALVLLAPVLFRAESAPAPTSPPPPARYVTVQAGESLELVAARSGVSVARLLALNPELGLFGLERGTRIQIR